MLPYFLLFLFFAVGTLLRNADARQSAPGPMFLVGAVIITAMVGLRYQVGGDWETYERYFSYARLASFGKALGLQDPGYQILNWAVARSGVGIWGVNLICAVIFTWGLVRFAKVQPMPWLSLVVAIPYLVTVVAMGYTRQAVAIGILMSGMAALIRGGSVLRFCAYAAVAALFHRTAVLVLPLITFAERRNRLINLIGVIGSFVLLYDALLADSVDDLVKNYVVAEYSSQGAAIRVTMNIIPAILFLASPHRYRFDFHEYQIWKFFSWSAVAMAILLVFTPSSTAVDRMALYVIPLQIAILSRLPIAYRSRLIYLAVIGYSCAILMVWLGFASNANDWLPYQFYPLS